jgi:hypothetical protein
VAPWPHARADRWWSCTIRETNELMSYTVPRRSQHKRKERGRRSTEDWPRRGGCSGHGERLRRQQRERPTPMAIGGANGAARGARTWRSWRHGQLDGNGASAMNLAGDGKERKRGRQAARWLKGDGDASRLASSCSGLGRQAAACSRAETARRVAAGQRSSCVADAAAHGTVAVSPSSFFF